MYFIIIQIYALLINQFHHMEIFTTNAFVSMVVSLVAFLSLQRYYIRSLVAGSVKGKKAL